RRAVLSEYDRWAKKHPNEARMMGGFLLIARHLWAARIGVAERADNVSCGHRMQVRLIAGKPDGASQKIRGGATAAPAFDP
ncbi:MAG: hypothetical protein WAK67_22300, partial [Xanthobacteraceae bacterium]